MQGKCVITFILLNALVITIASTVLGVGKKLRYFADENGKLEMAALADDREAIVKALANGADVNARGGLGVTPLMIAVDRLKHHAVLELLNRGANPNLKATDGNSAVSLAVENYRHSPEIFFAVMEAGGDPNIRRPDNDPVIMRFLNDRTCDYVRHMKEFGADLDITTSGGDPIITDVGTAADWDMVWCLIELGAKYDYEKVSPVPLSRSLRLKTPSKDSPIYDYKIKVWQFLKDHNIAVCSLDE